MALNPGIPSFFIVRDTAWTVRRTLTMFCIGSLSSFRSRCTDQRHEWRRGRWTGRVFVAEPSRWNARD